MKILVVQYWTDNLQYTKYTEALNKEYCDIHGYDYLVEKDSTIIRNICINEEDNLAYQWYKVKLVKNLLDANVDCDWILFLDADAVFSNKQRKIEDFIDPQYNLVFGRDVGHHSVANTGVFLVKKCDWSKIFFQKWWDSRNNTTGNQAKELLQFDGGSHKPELKSIFKYSLWHEQTCVSVIYKTDEDVRTNMKIIDNSEFNCHIYKSDGFVFHAFSYAHAQYRDLDYIYEAKVAIKEDRKKIGVVYFVYCINHFLDVAKNDFNRILKSGLYDDADFIKVVCSLPHNYKTEYDDLANIYEGKNKVSIEKVYGNKFEHYGIVRAWVESHKSDGVILYLHAKGIANLPSNTNDHSEWKRLGNESFTEMLKYFLIDRYKDCLEKLKTYDQVNVSDSYSRGWPSGNFWWSTMSYLRTVQFPFESTYDRWACEAWINFRSKKYSTYQFYDRYYFRDRFTYLPEASYKAPHTLKDKKIILDYAKLITAMEPENENDNNRPTNDHAVDFTEFVKENLEKNNYKGFTNILVSFTTLGRTIEDPLYGTLKSLVIAFHIEGDDEQYRLVGDEGAMLTYKIDSYTSKGYDFEYPNSTIREIIQT